MSAEQRVTPARSRSVLDCIGSTPLFALQNLVGPADGDLLVKWERANPGGSIKDRPALHMVDTAEQLGLVRRGSTLIESSSGNFGISLAMIGAARGYRVIVLVDPKTTPANLRVLEAFGAEIIVVDEPDDSGSFHKTRIVMANRLAREIEGSFRPDQIFNLVNSQAHYRSTGPELLAECGGHLDILVGTASSGGQLGGLSRYLHEHAPDVSVIGVDAEGSAIFGGPSAPYLIAGVGLGWTPANLDLSLIDAAYKISAEDAFYACRTLARCEGVLAGASSGAAIIAALRYAIELGEGSTVVCILSDGGDRYLDSVYDDDWLATAGFDLGEPTVAQLRARSLELTAAQGGTELLPTVIPGIREILGVPDTTGEINATTCREWTPDGHRPPVSSSALAGAPVPSKPTAEGTHEMERIEYIILGGGPAGLQTAYELGCQGRDYLVLEQGAGPGSFFRSFPRHRAMISINKVHTGCTDRETNLRWDWNSLLSGDPELDFTRYTSRYFPDADDYVRYLEDFVSRLGLTIRYDSQVKQVARDHDGFVLETAGGTRHACQRLIVATGISKPYIPAIDGIEHAEGYFDFSTDPEQFTDQRVLVIGKGNSGFETAERLIEHAASIQLCSPSPVSMAWKSHFVGHLRAVNNNFLDTYQLKSQNTILDADIDAIRPDGEGFMVDITYTHAMGDTRRIPFDRVLLCAGFRFDAQPFDASCAPALTIDDRFPAMTSEWESVNVPGMYFAGGLTQSRDFKRTASGFVHGFRHNSCALGRMLGCRHHDRPWPREPLPDDPLVVAQHIVGRLNTSAGMFLLNGFMGDVVVALDGERRHWSYYCDVPIAYAHDHPFAQTGDYYTVVLDYGDNSLRQDPFNVLRNPDPAAAADTYYLHPIIRRHAAGGAVRAEHHLVEDLENVYSSETYVASIEGFFRAVFA